MSKNGSEIARMRPNKAAVFPFCLALALLSESGTAYSQTSVSPTPFVDESTAAESVAVRPAVPNEAGIREREGSEIRAPVIRPPKKRKQYTISEICTLIQYNASAYGLPPAFFARLIWKESRFDVRALSPKGAQGIAQFMPATARIRGLDDPWDPKQAIPASASFLAFLREKMGNLGLAAASYNAGSDRVRRWMNGESGLPYETRDYVISITGHPAEKFIKPENRHAVQPLHPELDFQKACRKLPILKTRSLGGVASAQSPWGVQVAGHFNRSVAMAGWNKVRARFGNIIGSRSPEIVRVRGLRGLKPTYAVRLGAQNRGQAQDLCKQIRSAGGFCLVKKN